MCSGSGIAPNISNLKHPLHQHLKVRHTLIYANRVWEDVIFRQQLDELAAAHPKRLRIVHALSREKKRLRSSSDVRRGRVTEEIIRELVPDPFSDGVFVCGP